MDKKYDVLFLQINTIFLGKLLRCKRSKTFENMLLLETNQLNKTAVFLLHYITPSLDSFPDKGT